MAWNALGGMKREDGWRTIPITSAGPCRLRAGRRHPGDEESVLAYFPGSGVVSGAQLPEGHGFNVERADLQDAGSAWLALARRPSGSFDLFLAMVCDVTGALDAEAHADEKRRLNVFLGRVRAWQEFMRKGVQALTPEAEIGLVGEITVLSSIMHAGVPPTLALEAWVGPFDGLQDFELGTGALEVKATLSTVGFPAHIGSLEQLDDSVRQPLFVAGVRLRQTADGVTLPGLVGQLRTAVHGDKEAERLLSDRLLAAGYFAAHADRYTRGFAVTGTRVVEVDDAFPRLTHGRVPGGILRARYEIDLDRAQGTDVGTEGALKRTGVI